MSQPDILPADFFCLRDPFAKSALGVVLDLKSQPPPAIAI